MNLADLVQIMEEAVFVSFRANEREKDMNPSPYVKLWGNNRADIFLAWVK